MKQSYSAQQREAVISDFLRTGDSTQVISKRQRLGVSTVSAIINTYLNGKQNAIVRNTHTLAH